MKFTKMHGIGNDYVYINCFEEEVSNPSELSIYVSDRHTGVGSDGLVLIKPSDVADFRMDMFNADGSQSQMCGNAIRCVGKYVHDRGLTDKTEISVETLAGIKYLSLAVVDGKVQTVKVNMGAPILVPSEIPTTLSGDIAVDCPVVIGGNEYRITCVSMGNPHCISYMDSVEDVKNLQIEKVGPTFENDSIFPERVNAEFVSVIDRKTLYMRVWERGCGETWACGTGCSAAAVISILHNFTHRKMKIIQLGGALNIEWSPKDGSLYMESDAEIVYSGEINEDALDRFERMVNNEA